VPMFRCPSDPTLGGDSVNGVPIGPTNYAVCVGTGTTNGGAPYGSPWDADGMFTARDQFRLTDIADGLSNTAMMSESLLGTGSDGQYTPAAPPTPPPGNAQTVYAYLGFGPPLTPAACSQPTQAMWNVSQRRGFMWASGEMRCASYNHFLLPNSPSYDCVANYLNFADPNDPANITAVAFRAARSNHFGGVNLLLGDGSARFVTNSVSQTTWNALATRNGGEVNGNDY